MLGSNWEKLKSKQISSKKKGSIKSGFQTTGDTVKQTSTKRKHISDKKRDIKKQQKVLNERGNNQSRAIDSNSRWRPRSCWSAKKKELYVNASQLKDYHPLTSESVAREVQRHKSVRQLAHQFEKLVGNQLGSRKWFIHFESWLWARYADRLIKADSGRSSAEERSGEAAKNKNQITEPVIPFGKSSEFDAELVRKLEATGLSSSAARSACQQLGRFSTQTAMKLHDSELKFSETAYKVTYEKVRGATGEADQVQLSSGGVSLLLNTNHLHKLKYLYGLQYASDSRQATDKAQDAKERSEHSQQVLRAIFSCVARYLSISGGSTRAGGMQAAIYEECFNVLQEDFGVSMECFASPFNCRFANYCSAFVDVDRHFGSIGSFFFFRPRIGSFQANPPFDSSLVTQMRFHMEELLFGSDKPLSFIIIIPCWDTPNTSDPRKVKAWQGLQASRFCKHGLLLKQAEHGYFEGAQHHKHNQYRLSNHDTSIFFLQNDAGARKWAVTRQKIARLQEAFKPKHLL